MTNQASRVQRSKLFLWLGVLGIVVAIVGFTKTFFIPLFAGTFSAPPAIYIHGAFLFGWVGFFASQSVWVQQSNLRRHKQMGWLGGALVAGVIVSTLVVATLASQRTATASGDLNLARAELFVIMLEMTVFGALVISAFLLRRRSDMHKRLMLLALIASLGPAWFRFRHYFPPIDNAVFVYSLLLADSLIIIAAIIDLLRERRIHPVYLVVGSAMIAIHLIEVFAFDTPLFRAIANTLARPFI